MGYGTGSKKVPSLTCRAFGPVFCRSPSRGPSLIFLLAGSRYSLPSVLVLRLGHRLPLHVRDRIRSAASERHDVVFPISGTRRRSSAPSRGKDARVGTRGSPHGIGARSPKRGGARPSQQTSPTRGKDKTPAHPLRLTGRPPKRQQAKEPRSQTTAAAELIGGTSSAAISFIASSIG
jgi:hypothetical protein